MAWDPDLNVRPVKCDTIGILSSQNAKPQNSYVSVGWSKIQENDYESGYVIHGNISWEHQNRSHKGRRQNA